MSPGGVLVALSHDQVMIRANLTNVVVTARTFFDESSL